MRAFLFSAVIVFVVVASFLYVLRRPILERVRPAPAPVAPEAPPEKPPRRLSDVTERVRKIRHAPETQRLLLDFVQEAAKRGPAAVEEIRAALRDEPDVEFEARWVFEGGRLRGFPTLRAALLSALIGIPGREAHDALVEALSATSSADEGYLICSGLERRGEAGFTALALDRATSAGPGDVDVARDLVALAVRADPEGTAAEVLLRTPRGEDATDPVTLAQALGLLPAARAFATAKGLFADPQVTRNAKERYLESLCNRGEPDLFASMRELANEGILDRELRITLAYKAIGSTAFTIDEVAYGSARPGTEGDPRAEIRARYEQRLREVELLIDAAVPPDGPVRESLRRRVAERATRLR